MKAPIPPWFVKRSGKGWLVTGRGWVALLVLAVLLALCLFRLHGIARLLLTSLVVMGFMAISVAKIDLRRLQ